MRQNESAENEIYMKMSDTQSEPKGTSWIIEHFLVYSRIFAFGVTHSHSQSQCGILF